MPGSPIASSASVIPTRRTVGAWASLATTWASPDPTEPQGGLLHPAPQAPVERRCGQLHQRAGVDQRTQQFRPGLNLRVALRMGEGGSNPRSRSRNMHPVETGPPSCSDGVEI